MTIARSDRAWGPTPNDRPSLQASLFQNVFQGVHNLPRPCGKWVPVFRAAHLSRLKGLGHYRRDAFLVCLGPRSPITTTMDSGVLTTCRSLETSVPALRSIRNWWLPKGPCCSTVDHIKSSSRPNLRLVATSSKLIVARFVSETYHKTDRRRLSATVEAMTPSSTLPWC